MKKEWLIDFLILLCFLLIFLAHAHCDEVCKLPHPPEAEMRGRIGCNISETKDGWETRVWTGSPKKRLWEAKLGGYGTEEDAHRGCVQWMAHTRNVSHVQRK